MRVVSPLVEPDMSDRLAGKRALVTGASRGIGRAIAETFAAEGASVALLARSTDQLAAVCDDIEGTAVPISCDVRETESVEAAVDAAVEALGGLDVAVSNAGVIVRAGLVDTTDAEMERVIDVNLQGMMRVARATIPELAESDGTLINVSSQLGEVGVEGASVYCASKGGINNVTRQLALEYADEGVTVNALAPGVVETSMNEAVRSEDDEWADRQLENIPLDRLGTTTDIAGPAVFLASDESNYMTGHVLVVDGGWLAQ